MELFVLEILSYHRRSLPAIGRRLDRSSVSESLAQSEPSTTTDFATQDIVAIDKMRGGNGFSGRQRPVSVSPLNEFSSSRIRHLESRINANEQAYRGFLEELVRIQDELRANVRRNDERWKEERKDRYQLREGLQTTAEQLSELLKRVNKAEDRADVEKREFRSVARHLEKVDLMRVGKQAEKVTVANQEQQMIWNDRYLNGICMCI